MCARVLVNRLGGLSLPRKSVVRLTDHPDITSAVYRGRYKNNTTYAKSVDPGRTLRLRRLIWVSTVCKCPFYGVLGKVGENFDHQIKSSFTDSPK